MARREGNRSHEEKRSRDESQPNERGPEATRRRILEAAIEVFAEKGYHDTAVDDIVRASDTSKGAVYFHFPNKQGIFLVLVDELTKILAQRVERSIAREHGAVAKVEAALQTVIDTFTRYRTLSRILFIETAGAGRVADQKLMEIHSRFAEIIRKNLDEAVAEGAIRPMNTELAAYAWFGAINEVITRWLYTGQPESLADAVPDLAAMLLQSLGAVAEQSASGSQWSGLAVEDSDHPSAISGGLGDGAASEPQA